MVCSVFRLILMWIRYALRKAQAGLNRTKFRTVGPVGRTHPSVSPGPVANAQPASFVGLVAGAHPMLFPST